MNDTLEFLVRQAKWAHKSSQDVRYSHAGRAYYRGLRRGYLDAARYLKRRCQLYIA